MNRHSRATPFGNCDGEKTEHQNQNDSTEERKGMGPGGAPRSVTPVAREKRRAPWSFPFGRQLCNGEHSKPKRNPVRKKGRVPEKAT